MCRQQYFFKVVVKCSVSHVREQSTETASFIKSVPLEEHNCRIQSDQIGCNISPMAESENFIFIETKFDSTGTILAKEPVITWSLRSPSRMFENHWGCVLEQLREWRLTILDPTVAILGKKTVNNCNFMLMIWLRQISSKIFQV